MLTFPIGIMLESLRTDTPVAIKKAAELGANGLQVGATSGPLSPDNITPQYKKDFLSMCKDNGLVISALCGDFGHGFSYPEINPDLIEKSKRILYLAKELGTNIVTTHIGVVPDDPQSETYGIMQQACYELATYANSLDAYFAVETGPEPATVLKGFLDSISVPGLAVNLDPANLVMVAGDDPVAAVYTLKDYIVHTHAKDGRMLKNVPSDKLYGDIEAAIAAGESFIELPLGKGDVDFPAYLSALHEVGYKGFLTVEREVGEKPEDDIKLAVDYLRSLLSSDQ